MRRNNRGRETLVTKSWCRPTTVRRRSTWREYHDNVAVWKNDRGNAMWRYDNEHANENVDERSSTVAEKERSNSSCCGQFLKKLDVKQSFVTARVKRGLVTTTVSVAMRSGGNTTRQKIITVLNVGEFKKHFRK